MAQSSKTKSTVSSTLSSAGGLKVYEYPKCSTCVKALKFLADKKIPFEKFDITLTPPNKAELEKMIAAYGGNFRKLFNTSGIQYRELKIGERIDSMTAAEAVKLLSGNGKLVKRPFILKGDQGRVGFKEDEWKALLK